MGTLFLFLLTMAMTGQGWGYTLTETPDFNEGQWECKDPVPEIQEEIGLIWGTSRTCVLQGDRSIQGVEVFAFGNSQPFYKRWHQGSQEYYHSLHIHEQWALPVFAADVVAHVDVVELLEGRDKGKWVVANVTFTIISDEGFLSQVINNPDYSLDSITIQGKE